MKKIILITISILFSFVNSFAAVEINKEKDVLVVYFYKSAEDSISMDSFVRDYNDAINLALNDKRIKKILFSNNNYEFFYIIGSKDEILKYDEHLNVIKEKYIKAEAVSYEPYNEQISYRVGAKYRSTTYINGIVDSKYETDWNNGYFSPETSTMRFSDGTVVKTITEYVPAHTEVKTVINYRRIESTSNGLNEFINKVYFRN